MRVSGSRDGRTRKRRSFPALQKTPCGHRVVNSYRLILRKSGASSRPVRNSRSPTTRVRSYLEPRRKTCRRSRISYLTAQDLQRATAKAHFFGRLRDPSGTGCFSCPTMKSFWSGSSLEQPKFGSTRIATETFEFNERLQNSKTTWLLILYRLARQRISAFN